jgi:hypothetical protein
MANKRPRNVYETLGEMAADQANEAEREIRRKDISGKYTVLNGKRIPLEDIVDHEYIPQTSHRSNIFHDIKELLEHPTPGCMYAWPSKDDPGTYAKIRMGVYRPVEISEIKADTAVPIQTHLLPGASKEDPKKSVVCWMDVILVEIPERAVKDLYKRREADAAMRTVRQDASSAARNTMENLLGPGLVNTKLTVS